MAEHEATIRRIHAREVLDSRGRPTVEVEVWLARGYGRASVPSGASTGRHEAAEVRDGDPARHGGLGVRKAAANVREAIAPRLIGRRADPEAETDRLLCELDGTANKSRLGANAILAVSLALSRALASITQTPLWEYLSGVGPGPRMPLPMVNMISGGLHAGGNLDLQDFLLLPTKARSCSEAIETACAVYRALSGVLRKHGHEWALVGDEGGYGPRLRDSEQAIELLLEAYRAAGVEAGIALDVAATHFFRDGKYHLNEGGGRVVEGGWMVERLERWCKAYPILSIEDGLAEDDLDGWRVLTERLPHAQLIGDDLFVTNPARLRMGIERKLANAVLVKVNQIGTLTETFEVLKVAREAGYRAIVSARSGETEDPFLADLAVASGAGQIKIGGVARSERLAKYNQLLRIEEAGLPFAAWGG